MGGIHGIEARRTSISIELEKWASLEIPSVTKLGHFTLNFQAEKDHNYTVIISQGF